MRSSPFAQGRSKAAFTASKEWNLARRDRLNLDLVRAEDEPRMVL